MSMSGPGAPGPDALRVNGCELTLTQEATGQLLYQNAWITDHVLNAQTVRPLVAAGRARWKIENENNNVLKNHGYHERFKGAPEAGKKILDEINISPASSSATTAAHRWLPSRPPPR